MKDSNKQGAGNQDDGSSMLSPILTNLREETKRPNKNEGNNKQYRKMETDKTAPLSNQKSQTSPERNPQSQQSQYNSVSMAHVSEFQNQQSLNGPKKLQGASSEESNPTSNEQPVQNQTRKQPLDAQPPPAGRTRHLRGPSQVSQGAELTLDEESYDRERYLRDGSLQKDPAELFNDSQVSAIQNSGNLEFIEDGDEDQLQEEDTSARRLLPGEQLTRSKNQTSTNEDPRSRYSPVKNLRGTVIQNQSSNGQTLINFVDQSKEDYNSNQKFPIVKEQPNKALDYRRNNQQLSLKKQSNKVAPLALKDPELKNSQIIESQKEQDYFEFAEVDIKRKASQQKFSQFKRAYNSQTSDYNGSNYNGARGGGDQQYTRKNTQDECVDNAEMSCLLDESQLKKSVFMPNVHAQKVELQDEIGLHIVSSEGNKLHNDAPMPNDDSFYRIIDKDSIEVIEGYKDRCPCLNIRKTIMKIRVYMNRAAIMIITNSIFESISITVIVANSLFLALDDPLAAEPPIYAEYSENIFQVLYTVEMILKISAMGFLFNKGSYLRDSWNLLDFVIVSSGYLGMVMQGGGANLSVLRSFRVIRPLRTISSIEGLRVIVSALVAALPLLRDTILVLLFFFMIFAIAGVQLFSGALKNRCVNEETGVMDPGDVMCSGDTSCRPGQFCGKRNANPNNDATSFDNVLYAMLLIFQTVTLEGWTPNMIDLQMSVASWVVGYFIPIVFIGAFFLLNLTLAVIKSKFTEEHANKKKVKAQGGKKKKKVALKKRGIDDSSDDDKPADGGDEKNNLEEKMIKEIESIKNISPEKKKAIKDKYRLEELIKRLENAIKQRETREKVTPRTERLHTRTFSKGSSPDKLDFETNNGILSSGRQRVKTFDFDNQVPPMPNMQLFRNNLNYGELFQSNSTQQLRKEKSQEFNYENELNRIGQDITGGQKRMATFKLGEQEPIKEDDDESHELTVLLNGEELVKKDMGNKTDGEQEGKKRKKINKMLGINQDIRSGVKYFNGAGNKTMEQQKNKLAMRDIAGIKNRKLTNEVEADKKKAAFDRLQENFDIFEFLDADIENFGDDEMSAGDEDREQEITPPDQHNSNNGNGTYERKSTKATTEVHSFSKRNRPAQIRPDSQTEFLPQEQLPPTVPQIKSRPQALNLKRRQTVMVSHKNFIPQLDEEEPTEEAKSPDPKQIKQQLQKVSFKDKVMRLFKRRNSPKKKPPPSPVKRLNKSELSKSVMLLKKELSHKSFKSQKLNISSGFQLAGPVSATMKPCHKKNSSMQNTLNHPPQQEDFSRTSMGLGMTIRAKSEQRKKEIHHKDHQLFKEKEAYMSQRRNIFFSQAVKHLGKTKEQITKEKNEKLLKKRLINLGGGFELAAPKSARSKRKLLRSGSLRAYKNDKLEEEKKKIEMLDRQLSPQMKKRDSLVDEEFRKYYQKIKEEVKQIEADDMEIPNLQEVLYKKKKKIALKLKNYKFTSVHDVLEGRDEKQREVASQHGQNAKIVVKEKKKKSKGDKKKVEEQKRLEKGHGVNPYQKKVLLNQKKYMQELVAEDGHESDQDQEDLLRRLEGQYNVIHRSDIHVTGTLSIVFDKPKTHTKIMNQNYYANLVHQDELVAQQNMMATINIGSLVVDDVDKQSNKSNKDGSIYEQNLSVGSIGNIGRSNEQSALYVKLRQNNSQIRVALNRSQLSGVPRSAGRRRNKNNNSGGVSPMKRSQSNSAAINASRAGNVTATILGKPQPRPEVMTDRQILKRLNLEVKKSRIFSQYNLKKLPENIVRKENDLALKPKKPKKTKKKPANPLAAIDNSEEELSDTSKEDDGNKDDYFVDRAFDMEEAVLKAKNDANFRPRDAIEWSGQDIMMRFDPYKAKIALNNLNQIRVWPKGFYGYVKRWRTSLKNVMKHGLIENFMTLCVFANTIILSMDHYGIEQSTSDILAQFNTFFTITFSCEMFLKIIAVGLSKWLNDKMNYMDGTIVLMSLVEMVFMSGNGALSAFRSVRMFRTLRVLRVARLLRGLKSMMNIIAVIQRSISSFIYLGMLLFLFIFIYALLGMQLFGGQFNTHGSNRYNFDTFNQAFVTSFILLSMENWNQVMFNAMASTVNKTITVLYFISCIFVGNFMLLNLFLAILLDAFTAVEEEDRDTPEKKAKRDRERIEALKEKGGEDLITQIDEVEGATLTGVQNQKDKKKKKKKTKKTKSGETVSNILDESIEIDLETLASKKEETVAQKKKLFDGVECERAIYMFSKQNKIRIVCYKIITNSFFENFILVLIVLSSIKLISDTYFFNAPETDMSVIISGYLDLIFTVLFTSECAMKCIAYGFVQDNNSYLRETWSQMDFFIVVTSLIDASFQNVNIPIIKILRLLRILRPLRFISHNSNMKTVVVALLSSMGGIFNVGIVVVAVFLMFSILGTNLYAGKLQYCTADTYIVKNKPECAQHRGEWKTVPQNFDNVLNGMITLFTVATLEGWPDLMYKYTDITGVATGPQLAVSPINAYFWVGFVFIGAFFFMNLFVGVLFMNFEAAQKDEAAAMLLDADEVRWVDMMKMIVSTKPEIIKIPKNKVSQTVYQYVKPETKFDFFIMLCIILNMFQMAMTFEGQPEVYTSALEKSNYFFTAVFTIEATLKIIANGWAYFLPGWHKFDFFVVCSSFLDIVMGQMSATQLKVLRVGPQLARVLRVLRVSRLFKLLNKYKGLQALLQTITFSLPSLMNVFALLMLVYFIFSVLSVFMFNGIIEGTILDETFMNFQNFGQAMVINIRMSTGEDWPLIMYDTMITTDCRPGINCGLSYSPIYFIAFIMICSYVMLNLFIMIIIQQFEMYYLPDDNILDRFRGDLNQFKTVWMQYAKEFDNIKIRMLDLVVFFQGLKGELGMHGESENGILRNCVKLNLEADEEGFIYFNELLFKTMKRRYGQERTKKKILADLELKTLERLQKIKQQMIASSRKNERYKAVTVNPFLAVMYKNMSFRAWRKEYELNLPKRQEEKEFQLERQSEDEEEDDNGLSDWEYKTEKDISVNEEEYQEWLREHPEAAAGQQEQLIQEINEINKSIEQNQLEQEILDTLEKEQTNPYVQDLIVKDRHSNLDLDSRNQQQDSKFTIKLQKTQQLIDLNSQNNTSREKQQQEDHTLAAKNYDALYYNNTINDDELSRMLAANANMTNQHDQFISVIDNQLQNFETQNDLITKQKQL